MNLFIFLLEIIGTVAFSVSGAMTGLKKNMDIFGVSILALTTSVGGGIIRDIILGNTPPKTFQNPVYALISVCTAIVVFILASLNKLSEIKKSYEIVMLIMDSLGLGVFTVMGICSTYEISTEYSPFLLIFVGVTTGVGGGVLRDILAGNTPYIFVKHIYASASIMGAIICVLMWRYSSSVYAVISGVISVVIIRLLSAIFKWNLPKAKLATDYKS